MSSYFRRLLTHSYVLVFFLLHETRRVVVLNWHLVKQGCFMARKTLTHFREGQPGSLKEQRATDRLRGVTALGGTLNSTLSFF